MTDICTLIVSEIERQAVASHLDIQYRRLSDIHIDKEMLRSVLHDLKNGEKVISLTKHHIRVMLRHLRLQHWLLEGDMMGLEERIIRGGFDGSLNAAWRALDADSMCLADVIRRLWEMLT